jgi:hypothetical protein
MEVSFVNDELERIFKEAAVDYFKVLSHHLAEVIGENYGTLAE